MNDASILDKYVNRKDTGRGDSEPESGIEDLGAFGWLRGARERAIYLELRRRDGNIDAIGYAWLQKIGYDPSQGITLWFPGQKIRVLGQNLNLEVRPLVRLFEGMLHQRVTWIQETSGNAKLIAAENAVIVERIEG